MILITSEIPDISQYMQYIQQIQLSSDVTVICTYKTLFRSDNVILDLYLNEIADDSKIISSKNLTPNSLLCTPKYDLGFRYYLNCVDIDGINCSLNKNNASKFYLQFTSYEGENWS